MEIVEPNAADLRANRTSYRSVFNAITSTDALAAQIFHWAKDKKLKQVMVYKDDTHYREQLAIRNSNFRYLRDAAKALKHAFLSRGTPIVSNSGQIQPRYFMNYYFPGMKELFSDDGVIIIPLGRTYYRECNQIVNDSLSFLKEEMDLLGC